MLGLVLVASDCGIAAECRVKKSVNTSTVHFARQSPCAKMQSVTLTDLLVAQTITIGKQKTCFSK